MKTEIQTPGHVTMSKEYADDDEEEVITYHLLEGQPVKLIEVDGFPEFVLVAHTGKKDLVNDYSFARRIEESFDVEEITKNQFHDACLKIGVNPNS